MTPQSAATCFGCGACSGRPKLGEWLSRGFYIERRRIKERRICFTWKSLLFWERHPLMPNTYTSVVSTLTSSSLQANWEHWNPGSLKLMLEDLNLLFYVLYNLKYNNKNPLLLGLREWLLCSVDCFLWSYTLSGFWQLSWLIHSIRRHTLGLFVGDHQEGHNHLSESSMEQYQSSGASFAHVSLGWNAGIQCWCWMSRRSTMIMERELRIKGDDWARIWTYDAERVKREGMCSWSKQNQSLRIKQPSSKQTDSWSLFKWGPALCDSNDSHDVQLSAY